MTLYDILEISPTASPEMIEASWKVMMKRHHPDQGGSAERAKVVNDAHDILSDLDKRKAYDKSLKAQQSQQSPRGTREAGGNRATPSPFPPVHTPTFEEIVMGLAATVINQAMRDNPMIDEVIRRAQPIRRRHR